METHKYSYALTMRDASMIETTIEKGEIEYQTEEPQLFTRKLKFSDNLINFPIPSINLGYGIVIAKYIADDAAIGVKAGDPAPLILRINGATIDNIYNKGFAFLPSNLTDLKVSTTYDTNKIEVQVRLG